MPTFPSSLKKILTYLAIAATCYLIVELGLHASSNDYKSAKHWSTLINDPTLQLRGLIHVLKHYPQQELPEIEAGALFTPYALGVQEVVSPAEWTNRLMATEKQAPLVVFSKTYCPYSQRAKGILEAYKLDPPPFIVEANLRNDSARIKSYLGRLTGRSTFPNVILKGRSIGGSDEILQYDYHRELKDILAQGGVESKAHDKRDSAPPNPKGDKE